VWHSCGHGAAARSGSSGGDRGDVGTTGACPTAGDCVAVVDVPDDDAPPPGWGQWKNWPASAPEPAVGVLVMQEDGCVMLWRQVHGVEASLSHAVLPAPDAVVVRSGQERGHTGAPPAHFDEA
jgi:hypothetical protein